MANAVWGAVMAMGAWPKPWGLGQVCGGAVKSVKRCQGRGCVAKAVGAWPRPLVRGLGHGGEAKAEAKAGVAWPRQWGRAEGCTGMA